MIRTTEARPHRAGLGYVPGDASNKRQPGAKRGNDPKVAADQRGHGLGVASEVYAQSDLEQKLQAVRALELEVVQ